MSFSVIKDCGDIWNRLFDHRPFLSGEIKYFIKEFEESRGDREVKRLYDIAEWQSDIKNSQIPQASTSLAELNKNSALEKKRALRNSEWERFNNALKEKYSKIDSTFKEKEEELNKFYEDLEKKLYI